MFISLIDMPMSFINHLMPIVDPGDTNDILAEPSDELKKWLNDNKIKHKIPRVVNPHLIINISKEIGIEFTNKRDATLFKLRWA